MGLKHQFLTLLLLLSGSSVAMAQSDSVVLDRCVTALQLHTAGYPVEKVHLHLDRPWYGLGDTIWFKAYTVVGERHQLSAVSNVLYAELLNERDSLVKRLTLQLNAGTAAGEFALPYTYMPGRYRIRAYTRWMRNDGPEYFFNRWVTVGGMSPEGTREITRLKPGLPGNQAQQKAADNPDVQFFPEGGSLVAGLRSKVAVKAVNKGGTPSAVSGTVTDDNGIEVAEFTTRQLGMGSFALTPKASMHYKVRIACADGSSYTLNLPEAQQEGFILTLNNNNNTDTLYLKIASGGLLYQKTPNTAFYVIGESAGKVYFTAAARLQNRVFTAAIAKRRFPTGIARFTLFSQAGEPLNERIVFIQNTASLMLRLSAEKESYARSEPVKIAMEATTDTAKVTAGTFSVSVTDETKVPVDEAAEATILTDLLLSSELKGSIGQPNYYFTNRTAETDAGLDLLMLTQGYRSFEWKKILSADNPRVEFQPEAALSLSGTIKTPSGKPVPNGKVRLTSVKDFFVADTLTDLKGSFTFTSVDLADSTKVVINAKKAKGGDNVKVIIKEPTYAAADKRGSAAAAYPDAEPSEPVKAAMQQAYVTGQDNLKRYNAGKVIRLKQVDIKSKRNDYFNPVYSDNMKLSANLNGPGNANEVILGDKLRSRGAFGVLSSALVGKIPGVQIAGNRAYGQRASGRPGNNPKGMVVIVDGVQQSPDALGYIPVEDVYSIEVLTSLSYLSIYGSTAPTGALIITLNHGADHSHDSEYNTVDGLVTYVFKGFYKARKFYAPKYDVKKNAAVTDDRKTIYWNPDVITDKNGRSVFEFYNAGSPGTYRVVVEGIDDNGNLGRQVFKYKVE